MNKSFSMSRFLIIAGVLLMLAGSVLLFLGFSDVGLNFKDNVEFVCIGMLFFGLMFFIFGLIDLGITKKRSLNIVTEPQNVTSINKSSPWIYIGITVVVVLVCFMAFMFMVLNGFHD